MGYLSKLMPKLELGRATALQDCRRLTVVAPSAYLLGGVQTWLDYLVPGLEASGWQVTVLLAHGANGDANSYLQKHPFARAHLAESPTGTREGRVRALCEAIRMLAPEVVLAVNIVDTYEAVARLHHGGGAPKVAMALHGLHSSFYQDIAAYSAVLDGVIVTNRLGAAAAVARGGLPDGRVHYAPCGVLVPDFSVPAETSDKLALLYAGRFDAREKRVLDLLPILRALDRAGLNFSLKLAGAGPAETDLRNALLEFGERVQFLGFLSDAQMRETFYCPGAVALVMSPSETGPLAAWEAMANGVALVSSRFVGIGLEGGLRDGENCLTFPVGDTEAAAAAIARLADPALRRSLAKAGYEVVRECYSREASIRTWDGALRQIAGQQPLPACPVFRPAPTSGRLDRYLGIGAAESLRRFLGLRFRHSEPGGEWPHSYGADNDQHFGRLLADMDQRGDRADQIHDSCKI